MSVLHTKSTENRRGDGLRIVAGMAALMWLVEALDALDHHGLDQEGIRPRMLSGLPGIVFSPFLHASLGHLLGNTVPFVVLGMTIALGGATRVIATTVIVALVAGVGTWLTAPGGSVTVGASGIVFGYAAYLVSRGFFTRRLGQLAVGAVVGVVFGGALLWSLIPRSGVSWQDHLFGAIGGLVAARYLAVKRPSAERPVAAPSV
jgi:membrane associated rhomboid family serine protease